MPLAPTRTGHAAAGLRAALAAFALTALSCALAGCGDAGPHAAVNTGGPASTLHELSGDGGADGGDGGVCAPANVDPTRYLRQLSFDLRGRAPTFEELDRVARLGAVPADVIESMLHAPEFLDRVGDWHRSALWPNINRYYISAKPLVAWDAGDITPGQTPSYSTFSPYPELVTNAAMHPDAVVGQWGDDGDNFLRGGTDYGFMGCDGKLLYPDPAPPGQPQPTYNTPSGSHPYYDRDAVPLPYYDAAHCPNYCSNKTDAERADPNYAPSTSDFARMDNPGSDSSPHELDPPGLHCPDSHPYRVVNSCSNVTGGGATRQFHIRMEGYRMVRHYWSGGRTVRTCAYAAQQQENNPATGADCASAGTQDPRCGCGPEGMYCMPHTSIYNASLANGRVRDALSNEPLEIIASVVDRDEDYFNILTTRRSFVEGSLDYLYRHQLHSMWIPGGTSGATALPFESPAPAEALPQVPYDDTSWHEYVRNPEHSGVLTTPIYLGRFPTWRARVSQFRTSFMCRPFTPAVASFPSPDDPCTREPNMARRCGCQNCHAAIEPMTAWFARWSERNATYLSPAQYPAFDPYCQACALTGQGCTQRCKDQYVISTLDAEGAQFAGTLRGYLYRTPEEAARIDQGPAGLVAVGLASGELQSCAVRTAWQRLLNRPMTDAEARDLLPTLLERFEQSGHNYRALVREIVSSAPYRRVD